MDWEHFFRGKRVTIMGLGLLGRGVGDAVFLAQNCAELIVTDRKSRGELSSSIEKLKGFSNIQYVFGEHRLEDFRNRDFILKAAGVPLVSPYIAEAQKNRIPIEMDASLFAKLVPMGVTIIGVTGTRGKTTTTVLLYEILKAAGKRAFLGGNIKDIATLPLLKEVKTGDHVVLELDSWQLQGFGESKMSPHVAIFTTFLPDHMNYYGGDMQEYFRDKENIFRFQKTGDVFVVGEQAAERVNASTSPIAPIIAHANDVPRDWGSKLLGEHNRGNIACALAAARAIGVEDEIIRTAVESFSGVEGRLQLLREVNGVKIWNDNYATTPDATLAALRALGGSTSNQKRRIILIMGGTDKGLDLSSLLSEVERRCKEVVLIPGTGTDKLKAMSSPRLIGTGVGKLKAGSAVAETLEEVVRLAFESAQSGDTILFSPAFASFGRHFKNEYDRGDQFVRIVMSLESQNRK